ncbi:MAG: outer membrane beta-barrel protein [Vicinamibacterales bacterium]
MTRQRALVLVLLLAGIVAGGPAWAQEQGQVGVNLGFPTVGVTWHATDTIAMRPEFTFMFGSTSSSQGSGVEASEADQWGLGFGLSALFYLREWDGLRGYIAPRFAIVHASTDSIATTSGSKRKTSGNNYDLGAIAGVQYAISSRLNVFGELGLGYSNRRSETEGPGSTDLETTTWALAPRSAIGLIVYF